MRFSFLLREYEKGFHDFGRLGAFFFCCLLSLVLPALVSPIQITQALSDVIAKARCVLCLDGNGISLELQDEIVMRRVEDQQPLALYVYKTMVDPVAGRISFFKVISGCVRTDASVENYNRGENERMAHLAIMQGRQLIELLKYHDSIGAGMGDNRAVQRDVACAR